MNPDLRNLIALQDIDQNIVRILKEKAEVPDQVQALQTELDRLTVDHQAKELRYQELSRKRRSGEGEVDLMRSKLSRLKEQLMSVKTNKEYQAMLHEIQMAEDQIRNAEDRILDIMEEMETMEKELHAAGKDLKLQTAAIRDQIQAAEAAVPAMEQAALRLQDEKSKMEQLLPEELLARYRRIADHRKGVAMAEARDELCMMCHVRIRPQVYADLRQGESIHFCDSCSRILFMRETA